MWGTCEFEWTLQIFPEADLRLNYAVNKRLVNHFRNVCVAAQSNTNHLRARPWQGLEEEVTRSVIHP